MSSISGFIFYKNKKRIIITEDTENLKISGHIFNDINTIVIKTFGWYCNTDTIQKLNLNNKNHYYLANSLEEFYLLKKHTENVIVCHQNSIYVNERIFTISNCEKIYNGILISRSIKQKRIHLANLIKDNVVWVRGNPWVTFLLDDTPYSFLKTFYNLNYLDVLSTIQKSKIGIILSAIEGGNFATSEYLLCGLPVLTTPSYGGRDYYLTSNNSRYCDSTETEVKTKFDGMLSIEWDRDNIRKEYLNIINSDRLKFIQLIDKIFKLHEITENADTVFYTMHNNQNTCKTFYQYTDEKSLY